VGFRRQKMVNLNVEETSGVDHPAHLQEGWVVAKDADGTSAAEVFERFLKSTPNHKEQDMPEITEADLTEAVAKAVAEATAPLTEQIATLTAEKDEALAKAAPVADDTRTDLEKALDGLPPAAQAVVKAQGEALAKAQDEVRKERETRLDAEAVAVAKATYGHLAVDFAAIAPAIRKMAETDEASATAITEALTKASEQADSGRIFEEIGRGGSVAGNGGSAMTKAREVGKALVAAGTVSTIEQGVSKAFEDDPALYEQYRTEKDA